MYQTFTTNRLLELSKPISETIKKEQFKSSLQVFSLKNDTSLFSKKYIAYQSTLNISVWQAYTGKHPNCKMSERYIDLTSDVPDTDAIILEGTVVVNFLKPLAAKTFEDYAQKIN